MTDPILDLAFLVKTRLKLFSAIIAIMVLLAAFSLYVTNPNKPDVIAFLGQVIVVSDGTTPAPAGSTTGGLPAGIVIVEVTPTPTPAPSATPATPATPTPAPYVEPVFVDAPEGRPATPTPVPTIDPAAGQIEHLTPLTDQERYTLHPCDMPVVRTGKGSLVPDKTTFGEPGYHRGDTARLRVTVVNVQPGTINQETISIGLSSMVAGQWIKFPIDYKFAIGLELQQDVQRTHDFYVPIPEQLVPGFYKVDIDVYDQADGELICGVTKEVNII
ncbi:MAG: hypothetical protein A4E28_00011 [Methanocella sp. PtaU1.Bin125]|nr:MAG: hypothetical protein A4E28_00011 [Methanocella sp. PtaU1.Bin125]